MESPMKLHTLLAAVTCVAAASAAPPVSLLSGSAKDELAGDLRGLLLQNLPQPLYAKDNNWGHQEMVRKRHCRGRLGDDLRVEITHEPKNDGVWKRLRVDAVNPAETLVFDLRGVTS